MNALYNEIVHVVSNAANVVGKFVGICIVGRQHLADGSHSFVEIVVLDVIVDLFATKKLFEGNWMVEMYSHTAYDVPASFEVLCWSCKPEGSCVHKESETEFVMLPCTISSINGFEVRLLQTFVVTPFT